MWCLLVHDKWASKHCSFIIQSRHHLSLLTLGDAVFWTQLLWHVMIQMPPFCHLQIPWFPFVLTILCLTYLFLSKRITRVKPLIMSYGNPLVIWGSQERVISLAVFPVTLALLTFSSFVFFGPAYCCFITKIPTCLMHDCFSQYKSSLFRCIVVNPKFIP